MGCHDEIGKRARVAGRDTEKPGGRIDRSPGGRKEVAVCLGPEVCDQNLRVSAARDFLGCVGKLHLLDAKANEKGAHFGNVVQGQDELAAQGSQTFRQPLEIRRFEVVPVKLPAVIGRVKVKKRGRTVVPPQDLFVRQVLDLHPFQSLMSVFNELGEAFEIESWRLDDVPMVIGMAHEAREGTLQDVEIPCRPLDIGQGRRVGGLEEFEACAAHEGEAEIPEELLVVLLADAEEVRDLVVPVIQDLHSGRLLLEKDLRAARECFYIGRVFREHRDDPLRERAFSANVREWANHSFQD